MVEMHLYVDPEDQDLYDAYKRRAADLRRERKKGLVDPELGRIPRGADIAAAQGDVDRLVKVTFR